MRMRGLLSPEDLDKYRNTKGKSKQALGKTKSFVTDRFYRSIQRRFPHMKDKYTDTQWREAMNAFWDTVGDVLIHQPNGVVLEGLGYFAFPAYTKKARNFLNGKTTFRNNGLIYEPQFFGDLFNSFWLSGASFKLARKFSRPWLHLVGDGMNYKVHYHNLKALVGKKKKRAY